MESQGIPTLYMYLIIHWGSACGIVREVLVEPAVSQQMESESARQTRFNWK